MYSKAEYKRIRQTSQLDISVSCLLLLEYIFGTLKCPEVIFRTMKHSIADHIWAVALELRDRGNERSRFQVDEVMFELSERANSKEQLPSERTVRDRLNTMVDLGVLDSIGGMGTNPTLYEHPDPFPGECEWCGAPFPEAGRMDVQEYDADGDPQQFNQICSACLRKKY